MSGLFGLLNLGSNAIAAQNAGVAVSGRNVSNVNTEGYQRESVNLLSERGAPLVGGVRASGLLRSSSEVLSMRERLNDAERGEAGALSAAAADMEGRIAAGGNDITNAIANLFGGLLDLTSAPMDSMLRMQVVSAAREIAQSFRRTAAMVEQAVADSDGRIENLAQAASELAARIAEANQAMKVDPDPVIADQRDLAARKLSELVGGKARIDPDGHMRFVLSGGQVLVDGVRAATLEVTPDAKYQNRFRVDVVDGKARTDVTTKLDGGKLAGEITFRDVVARQLMTDLDQLAFDFAGQMNTVHAAGQGLDGVSGRNLFVAPGGVTGAAAAMAVDNVVDADPRTLAAAAAGAATGDNSNALAMVALRDQPLAGGGVRTFLDQGIHVLAALGAQVSEAQGRYETALARTDVLAGARDSLSGVSREEEMQKLAAYQHAFEASTRFLATVNDLLDSLIRNL